jgi:SecD-like export protein
MAPFGSRPDGVFASRGRPRAPMSRRRRMRTVPTWLALIGAALIALGGCSSDQQGSETTILQPTSAAIRTDLTSDEQASSSVGQTSSRVNLRPVLSCLTANSTTTSATTAPAESDDVGSEPLPTRDGQVCQVGPPAGDATVFEPGSAQAEIIQGGWGVTVSLNEGDSGEGVWNAVASECYSGETSCPSHQLAIELDGTIVSAPTVNAPSFAGSVQITGRFSRTEAEALAEAINIG